MATPDNKIIIAVKGDCLTEQEMTDRLGERDAESPAVSAMAFAKRVRKEYTAVKNLVEREAQLRVFRGLHKDAVR